MWTKFNIVIIVAVLSLYIFVLVGYQSEKLMQSKGSTCLSVSMMEPSDGATYQLTDLTVVIQGVSHECLLKAASTLHKFLPSVPYLIGTENFDQANQTLDWATWVPFDHDTGIARARNTLLGMVKTPTILFLDEDFVFEDDPTDALLYYLQILETREYDMVGGCLVGGACAGYSLKPPTEDNPRMERNKTGQSSPGNFQTTRVDMIDNFYVGRVSSIKKVMWDDFLKVGEHEDFFLRATGVLEIGFSGALYAKHDRSCRPSQDADSYNKARSRIYAFWKYVFQKWRIVEYASSVYLYKMSCKTANARYAENLDDCEIDFDQQRLNPWGQVMHVPDPFPVFYRQLPVTVQQPAAKIGVAVVAIGHYTRYIPDFVASIKRYFVPRHPKKFYIFTDTHFPLENDPDIVTIYQTPLGWPYDSLMRFELVLRKLDIMDVDYLYLVDVDVEVVREVDDRILSGLVGAISAWHWSRSYLWFPYDRFPSSPAYIPRQEGRYYFAGGFYGGEKGHVTRMLEACSNMSRDMLFGSTASYVSPWHDASIVNFYFNKVVRPTLIAGPEFLYPEPPADSWLKSSVLQYYKEEEIQPIMYNLGVRKSTIDKNIRQYEMVEVGNMKGQTPVLEMAEKVSPFSCSAYISISTRVDLCGHAIPGRLTREEALQACARLQMTVCTIEQHERLQSSGFCSLCLPVHIMFNNGTVGRVGSMNRCVYCGSSRDPKRYWTDSNFRGGVTCCKYIEQNV